MTERMKAGVNEDSVLVVIPSGMTKLLRPLDVVINWSFTATFPLRLQLVNDNHEA
jgi:hypothetical protein